MNRKQYALLVVLTIFTGLIGGAVTDWILIGQPAFVKTTPHSQKIIEANGYHLVDKDGRLRGALSLTDDGSAGIILSNTHGKSVISLMVNPDGTSALHLSDNNEKLRVAVSVKPNGLPGLAFYDGDKIVAGLTLGNLNIASKDGKSRIDLVVDDALLGIRVDNHNGNIFFTVRPDGTPILDLYGVSKSFATLAINSDGNPFLKLGDNEGKQRAVLGSVDLSATPTGSVEKRPVSSLVLFDKDGKVLWNTP